MRIHNVEEIVRAPVATDSETPTQPPQVRNGSPRAAADDPINVRDRALVEQARGDLERSTGSSALPGLSVRAGGTGRQRSRVGRRRGPGGVLLVLSQPGPLPGRLLSQLADADRVNAATDVLRYRKRRPADPFPEWEDDALAAAGR